MPLSFQESHDRGGELVVFVRLFPRYNPRSLTLEPTLGSGTSVYSTPLPYSSRVTQVKVNSTTYTATTLAGLATPTASKYYYDAAAEKLYIDVTGLGTFLPNSTHFVSVEYEVNLSTKEQVFHYTPNNVGTDLVRWHPHAMSFPSINKSIDGNFQGFTPTITSSIQIANSDGLANTVTNVASLSGQSIDIYVGCGDYDATTVIKFFSGTVNAVDISQDEMSVSFSDKGYRLDDTASLAYSSPTTFSQGSYPTVDPQYANTIIPTVYGMVDNHPAVNISFNNDAPSASDNTEFLVCKFNTSFNPALYQHSYTVQASPAPTATRIYLNTVSQLNPGDVIYGTSGIDTNFRITGVNRTSNYVDGTDGLTSITAGTVLTRYVIGNVKIFNTRTGVTTLASLGGASPVVSFSFTTGQLKLTLSSNTFVDPPDEHIILCRVYGVNANSISGTSTSLITGAYTKWHQVMHAFFRTFLVSSEMDEAAFLAADANRADYEDVGFTLPRPGSTELPTNRDVINEMLSTRFASVYQNISGEVSFLEAAPITAYDYEFTADDIFMNSFSYNENSTDLTKTTYVNYSHQHHYRTLNATTIPTTYNDQRTSEGYEQTSASNTIVSDHYKGRLNKFINTVIQQGDQASTYASRARTVFQYPYNTFTFSVSLAYLGIELGDRVKIDLESLPGYNSFSDQNSLSGRIVGLSISESGIQVTVWDQIGIQQNQGVW